MPRRSKFGGSMKKAALLTLAIVMLSATAFAAAEGPVKKVEPNKVCMINEQFMDREQIPIEVDGKVYFGCCNMCKERLGKDASTRVAIDPVSKKKVDKATAVIGATADGSVLYFETEKNLEKYNASLKR